MILDEIKKASINALKEKDQVARSIYAVISNKAMLETIRKREKGEELNDADMVQIIQKTIKELTEEAENYKKVGNITEESNILKQRKLIENYLPKMLSEEEIKTIISTLSDKSIGNVMKHFKMQYAGKCDMRLVGEIAKTFNA
jgi:uncharacterized protein YqeY